MVLPGSARSTEATSLHGSVSLKATRALFVIAAPLVLHAVLSPSVHSLPDPFSSLLGFGTEPQIKTIPLSTGKQRRCSPIPKLVIPEPITTTIHTHFAFRQSSLAQESHHSSFVFLAVFRFNLLTPHHIQSTRIPSLVLALSADFGPELSVLLSHFPQNV